MLAFLLQYCADANVTRVARYDVGFEESANCSTGALLTASLRFLKEFSCPPPPFKRDALLCHLGQWGGYAGEVPDESAVAIRQT
jgi:hypothetical protein